MCYYLNVQFQGQRVNVVFPSTPSSYVLSPNSGFSRFCYKWHISPIWSLFLLIFTIFGATLKLRNMVLLSLAVYYSYAMRLPLPRGPRALSRNHYKTYSFSKCFGWNSVDNLWEPRTDISLPFDWGRLPPVNEIAFAWDQRIWQADTQ